MKRFWIILMVITLFSANAWALTKPMNVRNYDMTYQGVVNTGINPSTEEDYFCGTLYRDHQLDPLCENGGEGYGSHPGVDIPCDVGTVISNIALGNVLFAGYNSGWGNYVMMEHNIPDVGTIYSVYAHLNATNVATGNQNVAEGATIGWSGNSGNSTGSHLHFQIDRANRLNDSVNITNHPSWPLSNVNDVDGSHVVENYTINPMPFLQMDGYTPSYIPVGFVLNADYSGNPSWRTSGVDGVSQVFRDRYDEFFVNNGTVLGFPWDNTQEEWINYGQAVHKVDDMWIQDFYGPHNGLTLPYSALIKGGVSDPTCLLKEGFWDYWINNAGWVDYGYPVTNEYNDGWGVPHQTFRKNGQQIVFSWNGTGVDVEYMSGVAVNQYNVTFTSLAKVTSDGVYHSNLLVTAFNIPIKLIEGRTYNGFYASVGGINTPIDPFVVTGDMIIIVDEIAPVANFTADKYLVQVGEAINLLDQSLNSPTTWYWTFGDGNTSSQQYPNHSYSSIGEYTVSLTVSNNAGSDSYTWNNCIIVLDSNALEARFTADITSGATPLIVQFTDQSVGVPSRYYWDFGDGGDTSSVQNPVHTYTVAGTYNVMLLIGNAYGTNIMNKINYIVVIQSVQANFSYNLITFYPPPGTVVFADQSLNYPTAWFWDFGDGQTSTERNPNNSYQACGTYYVSLTASNQYSSDTFTDIIYIIERINPSFSTNVTFGPAPLTVQFNDLSGGGPISWAWDFGDGGGECCAIQNPIYTYNTPGVYTVRMDADNGAESDFIIRTDLITVTDSTTCIGNGAYGFNGLDQHLELATIPYTPNTNPMTIELRVKTTEAVGHIVCFTRLNDGVTDIEKEGIFLNMRSDGAMIVNVSWEVNNYHRFINFASVQAINDGEWHSLSIVIENSTVASAKLYIDGNLDASMSHASETYDMDYSFGAWLIGCYKSYSALPALPANFFSGIVDEVRVSKVARTAAEISNYYVSGREMIVDVNTVLLWHMNGNVGTPEKLDNAEGNNVFDLIEYNNPQAISGFNECLPFLAGFTATPNIGKEPLTVQFTDNSTNNPTAWLWDFGDGATSTWQNPRHVYEINGSYSVSLIASKNAESDTLAKADFIIVNRDQSFDRVHLYAIPNPFNPMTVIKFTIYKSGYVNLSIFDARGRRVAMLMDEILQKGMHESIFNGNGLASGTYFCKLSTPEGSIVSKIMLVK